MIAALWNAPTVDESDFLVVETVAICAGKKNKQIDAEVRNVRLLTNDIEIHWEVDVWQEHC